MEVEHGFIVGAILGVLGGFGLGWGFGRLSLRDELRRECADAEIDRLIIETKFPVRRS